MRVSGTPEKQEEEYHHPAPEPHARGYAGAGFHHGGGAVRNRYEGLAHHSYEGARRLRPDSSAHQSETQESQVILPNSSGSNLRQLCHDRPNAPTPLSRRRPRSAASRVSRTIQHDALSPDFIVGCL